MKRLLTALLPLCCAASAWAMPEVKWTSTDHDFGVIREDDGLATCRFTLHNTGNEPLTIMDARATCGCTTPIYSSAPIAPGDSATVEVSFDPEGRPGRFDKKIYIDTNANPVRSTLRVHGTIIGSEQTLASRYPYTVGPMRLKAKYLIFGDFLEHESRSNYIEGYNASADTLRPVFTTDTKLLSIKVEPEVVPPGEQFIYSVVVRSDKGGRYGPQHELFTAYPAKGAEESLTLEVTLNVNEDFSYYSEEKRAKAPVIIVDNTRLDAGTLEGMPDEPITLTLTVENRGQEPLVFRRIYLPEGSGVTAEVKDKAVKKGKSTTVTFTVSPEAFEGGILNTTADLITNDPAKPVTQIRLVGLCR